MTRPIVKCMPPGQLSWKPRELSGVATELPPLTITAMPRQRRLQRAQLPDATHSGSRLGDAMCTANALQHAMCPEMQPLRLPHQHESMRSELALQPGTCEA